MHIAGIDEVGRGALAGPVFVGAVIITNPTVTEGLKAALGRTITDSKKLTRLQRERASLWLKEHVDWSIGIASAEEVNNAGVVGALRLASGRALEALSQPVEAVQADAGLHHPFEALYPTEWFVKGDERILPITCASIIAKVERDAYMTNRSADHPAYEWHKNVGYGTVFHCEAIRQYGATPEHRPLFLRNLLVDAR